MKKFIIYLTWNKETYVWTGADFLFQYIPPEEFSTKKLENFAFNEDEIRFDVQTVTLHYFDFQQNKNDVEFHIKEI